MDKKKITIIAVMAVILVALIVVLLTNKKTVNSPSTPVNVEPTEQEVAIPSEAAAPELGTNQQEDKFRAEVPAEIKVPGKDTELSEAEKKEIALPTVVTPAAPGIEAQFRSFDIMAEGDKFIPSKVIANVGDTVHINFTAVDKAYDIVFPSYNMKQTAKKGETKILEFQAVMAGDFLYYCEACGGATSGTKGNIIIVEKK